MTGDRRFLYKKKSFTAQTRESKANTVYESIHIYLNIYTSTNIIQTTMLTNIIRKTTTKHAGRITHQQVRMLNVHEYISMDIMNQHQIATPLGAVITTPQEAEDAKATKFAGKDAVIKAQVLSGGRGLGTFKNGFQGGVHMVTKPEQVRSVRIVFVI